jgi:hypothetical protein
MPHHIPTARGQARHRSTGGEFRVLRNQLVANELDGCDEQKCVHGTSDGTGHKSIRHGQRGVLRNSLFVILQCFPFENGTLCDVVDGKDGSLVHGLSGEWHSEAGVKRTYSAILQGMAKCLQWTVMCVTVQRTGLHFGTNDLLSR